MVDNKAFLVIHVMDNSLLSLAFYIEEQNSEILASHLCFSFKKSFFNSRSYI